MRAPTFVGRVHELASLRHALAVPPAAVVVQGEPGVGKSRLVREALGAIDRRRVFLAVCPPFREPATLGPVLMALRQYAEVVATFELPPVTGALRSVLPDWAFLPPELPAAPSPSEARDRTFAALVTVLAELERLGLRAVVLENAQWADEATIELLQLLTASQDPALTVVLTVRPGDVSDGGPLARLLASTPAAGSTVRVDLRRLESAETVTLAASMLDGVSPTLSPSLARLLHEHSAGLPLGVEESLRSLSQREQLVCRAGVWARTGADDVAVPGTVRDTVLERVGRMTPSARDVLAALAVIGDPTSEELVLRVADVQVQTDEAVGATVAAGLVEIGSDGVLSFAHPIAARAVYSSLSLSLRRSLHRAAARELEETGLVPEARLARHCREGNDRAGWQRHAERAADAALRLGDVATCFEISHDLLSHAELSPAGVARVARLLPCGAFSGPERYEAAVAVLESQLADVSLPPSVRGELRLLLGRLCLQKEEFARGHLLLAAAVPDLAERPRDAAWALLLLAQPHGWGDWTADVHRDWLRQAEVLIDQNDLDAGPIPFGIVSKAVALLTLGDPSGWTQAERIPDESPEPGYEDLVTIGHVNIGDLAMRWGRYDVAAAHLDAGLAQATRLGATRIHDVGTGSRLHLEWFRGQWGGLAERVAAFVGRGDLQPMTRAEAVLVAALLSEARGDARRAAAGFDEAARVADETGGIDFLAEPVAGSARLLLAAGRPAEALAVTDHALERASSTGVWLWCTELAAARVSALLVLDRVDDADWLARAFVDGVGPDGPEAARIAAQEATAIVASAVDGPAVAAAALTQAADAWAVLGRPYAALLARERAAGCLAAAGREPEAVATLQAIREGSSRLGASVVTNRVGRTLQQLGVHAVPIRSPGRPAYSNELSPREIEIVRLLAEGRTNRAISERLVLSPKTVATHVSSAMRKFGVTSRTALAVRAIEQGIVSDPVAGSPGDEGLQTG